MTTAIVHDFLTQRGGAERVVLHIAGLVEDPVIVTSTYAPNSTFPEFRRLPVWADRIVSDADAAKFRRRALSYAKSFREKDLSFADEVIISTSTFAHNVRAEDALVYWYTPPRFLYDPTAYFSNPVVAKSFGVAATPLRHRDRKAAVRAQPASRRLRPHGRAPAGGVRHRGRRALPPLRPIAIRWIGGRPPGLAERPRRLPSASLQAGGYRDSRRVPWPASRSRSSVGDRTRSACARSRRNSSTFAGSVSDDELIDAYDKHSMVLVPGIEDFGYIPLEAASRGRPVIATREGGPAETVIDGTTGVPGLRRRPGGMGRRHPPGERDGLECRRHAASRSCRSKPSTSTTVSSAVCGLTPTKIPVRQASAWRRPRELSRWAQSCRLATKSRNFFEGSTPSSANIRSQRPMTARTRLRLPASSEASPAGCNSAPRKGRHQ